MISFLVPNKYVDLIQFNKNWWTRKRVEDTFLYNSFLDDDKN